MWNQTTARIRHTVGIILKPTAHDRIMLGQLPRETNSSLAAVLHIQCDIGLLNDGHMILHWYCANILNSNMIYYCIAIDWLLWWLRTTFSLYAQWGTFPRKMPNTIDIFLIALEMDYSDAPYKRKLPFKAVGVAEFSCALGSTKCWKGLFALMCIHNYLYCQFKKSGHMLCASDAFDHNVS